MIVGLFTSREVLRILGVENYGIYGVVGSIVVLLGFLNTAMSGATSRFITYELGSGDNKRLCETFSAAIHVHFIIALLIFAILQTIGLWYVINKLVIPPHRLTAAIWVYESSIISTIIGILMVPYNACIIAHERFNIYARLELLNVFLKLAIVYLLLLTRYDTLIIYGLLSFAVSLIIASIIFIYCKRNFAESEFTIKFNKIFIKPLLSFSAWDMFGHMSYSFRQQGFQILLNKFGGVLVNAAFSLAAVIQGVFQGFSSNIFAAMRPPIVKSYAQKNNVMMCDLIYSGAKIAVWLGLITIVPFLLNIEWLLHFWLGEIPQYLLAFSFLSMIFNYVNCISPALTIGIQATGKVKIFSFLNGSYYLLSLPLLYIILHYTSNYSSAFILQILTGSLYVFSGIILLKRLIPEFDISFYFLKIIAYPLLFGICIYLGIQCLKNIIYNSFLFFVISFIVNLVLTSGFFYFFIISMNERNYVLNLIKKFA